MTGPELLPATLVEPGAVAGRPEPDRYDVGRLTAAWLARYAAHTRAAYLRDLRQYLGWCQEQGLDPLTARPADLDLYRVALASQAVPVPGGAPGRAAGADGRRGAGGWTATPPTAATVHRKLSAVSSWYRYLLANRAVADLSGNPVAGARRPRLDRDSSPTAGLTTEEVRALLRCAEQRAAEWLPHPARVGQLPPGERRRALAALRDRALLRLLADLGLRVGEALGLDVASLSHNRGRPTVRFVGKGGRVRERPLPPTVTGALEDYLAARRACGDPPTGPLFATTARGGGPPGRLDEPAVFRLVRRTARQAGLPAAGRLSPHSLRHAFATNAREAGVPLEDVQDAMGHADTRTTRRYDRDRYALERDPALRLGDLYRG